MENIVSSNSVERKTMLLKLTENSIDNETYCYSNFIYNTTKIRQLIQKTYIKYSSTCSKRIKRV